jgi:hypothetical protein
MALELCRRWQWHNAAGQIKDMVARSFLDKLQARGWIQLPLSQRAAVQVLRLGWPLCRRPRQGPALGGHLAPGIPGQPDRMAGRAHAAPPRRHFGAGLNRHLQLPGRKEIPQLGTPGPGFPGCFPGFNVKLFAIQGTTSSRPGGSGNGSRVALPDCWLPAAYVLARCSHVDPIHMRVLSQYPDSTQVAPRGVAGVRGLWHRPAALCPTPGPKAKSPPARIDRLPKLFLLTGLSRLASSSHNA